MIAKTTTSTTPTPTAIWAYTRETVDRLKRSVEFCRWLERGELLQPYWERLKKMSRLAPKTSCTRWGVPHDAPVIRPGTVSMLLGMSFNMFVIGCLQPPNNEIATRDGRFLFLRLEVLTLIHRLIRIT